MNEQIALSQPPVPVPNSSQVSAGLDSRLKTSGVTCMATATKRGSILYANLCEVERGVFYASYIQGDSLPNTNSLPNYQVGRSASEAKQRFERNAYAIGYDAVNWRESIVAPAFP